MTKVLHARLYRKATEIEWNLRRKKIEKPNGSNFLRNSLEEKDNSCVYQGQTHLSSHKLSQTIEGPNETS